MGQVLHGSATTTEAIRRAIQHSEASLRALAKRYGINQKTVAKWKRRTSVVDVPTGPKAPRSTVLSVEDEAVVIAFRRHTLLPLDDCLYALQAVPDLIRDPALHPVLPASLPSASWDQSAAGGRWRQARPEQIQKLSDRLLPHRPRPSPGQAIAEVRTEVGKLHLFVAIDRTSKFAFIELHEKATTRVSGDFLRRLIEAVPYKVHTVLTDNGIQFTTPGAGGSAIPEIREAMARGELFRAHAFEYACAKAGIDHRTTKPRHPWTNGQVERMNRTIKDATVKRFHYDNHDQLRHHLADFVSAYNFGRRLKTLKGLTPYEFICKRWTTEPNRFILNSLQQMPGLNI